MPNVKSAPAAQDIARSDRFPHDFRFQLTSVEVAASRSQIVTLNQTDTSSPAIAIDVSAETPNVRHADGTPRRVQITPNRANLSRNPLGKLLTFGAYDQPTLSNLMTQPLPSITTAPAPGLLGDHPARNYARKLSLFNRLAEPELRTLIAGLELQSGMRVLDAGCGTGETLNWLHEQVQPQGTVVGLELSEAHVAEARIRIPPSIEVRQGDLLAPPFEPSSFDLIWCVNTLNHLHDPLTGVRRLKHLLKPGGRLSLGQSAFLPDMFFAWDSRLERVVNEAVRQYYRDRYGLIEKDLTGIRALVGLLRRAECRQVTARTITIERTASLDEHTRRYLLEAIFRDTWGTRLSPYLTADDAAELARLCDPSDSGFALERPDFHFLQTFTLVVGNG